MTDTERNEYERIIMRQREYIDALERSFFGRVMTAGKKIPDPDKLKNDLDYKAKWACFKCVNPLSMTNHVCSGCPDNICLSCQYYDKTLVFERPIYADKC